MILRSRGLYATVMVAVLVSALLTGCATPQASHLQQVTPVDLPHSVAPLPVPFIAQEEHECGPAALAMALQSAGRTVSADALSDQVYLPGRKGSLQIEMLAATRRHGLLPYPLQAQVQDVLREVAAGHPVVVFVNLGLPVIPVWHYAVVLGYDLSANTLTLHSGVTADMPMSLYTFERTWVRAGSWAMVALPPDKLPATADAERFSAAAAALESVDAQAAHAAYVAALQRWPGIDALLIGRGNSSYALGALAQATREYREAVEVKPDFADAWNNLAQVLWETRQPDAALAAAQRAVQLGGIRAAQYGALLRQIEGDKEHH